MILLTFFPSYVLFLSSPDDAGGPSLPSVLGHLHGGLQVLLLHEVLNDGLHQAEGSLCGVDDDALRPDLVPQLGHRELLAAFF